MEKKCDDPTCELGYRYDDTKPRGQRNIRCPQCRPEYATPVEPPATKRTKPHMSETRHTTHQRQPNR